MSAISFVNNVPASIVGAVEFRLLQGSNQIARIGVHSGGKAQVPTTASYQVQASTSMGSFSLTSNTLSFTDTSAVILAQVLTEDGYYDFQLVQQPGTMPQEIILENTWRQPVTFNITQPGTPVQVVSVVDEHNNGSVSTAQQWSCYVIANGITSAVIQTTNPNATFVVTPDNNDDDFTLSVQ